MSAHHGQGFATWLIMIPLLVVPLIAVFGVPQLAPITARTADGATEEHALQLELGTDAPLSESVPPFPGGTIEESPFGASSATAGSGAEKWTDPFENPTQFASSPQNGTTREMPADPADIGSTGSGEPFSQPKGSAATPQPDARWTQPGFENRSGQPAPEGYTRNPSSEDASAGSSATPSETGTQLTWREAVARLNQLGVQKFQLSQTEEPFVFQFVCDLSRRDNPRITHRFEAKAGEPLKAVENVIQQVESWSAQQASR